MLDLEDVGPEISQIMPAEGPATICANSITRTPFNGKPRSFVAVLVITPPSRSEATRRRPPTGGPSRVAGPSLHAVATLIGSRQGAGAPA